MTGPIEDTYDRRAYERLAADLTKEPSVFRQASGRLGRFVGSATQAVTEKIPTKINEGAEQAFQTAFAGVRKVTLDPAMRSVSVDKVLQGFQRAGHPVASIDDVRALPLRAIDDTMPDLRWLYSAAAAVEGAGAGVVITGGEVLGVGTAGAGAAPAAATMAGTMAFDAATVLAASSRVVAHTAAYYGYNTRLVDEELFALTVINWATATGEGAKAAAFGQLSDFAQQLGQGEAWAGLSEDVAVEVVQEMYARLGFRLAQRKLGQAIPVAGIALGAGMNASLLHAIGHHAKLAYRARHLADAYGFEMADLLPPRPPAETDGEANDVIDIQTMAKETVED